MKYKFTLTTFTLLSALIVFGISSSKFSPKSVNPILELSNLKDTTDFGKGKSDDSPGVIIKAEKISGKYVFVDSEPVRPYEVVYKVKLGIFSRGNNRREIADLVIRKAMKMEKKEGKSFDAVIIGPTKYDLAIKYK